MKLVSNIEVLSHFGIIVKEIPVVEYFVMRQVIMPIQNLN
jgi:hypothetical protein